MEPVDLVKPSGTEDPWDLSPSGFYRRWWQAIPDPDEFVEAVRSLTGTTHDHWIPHWRALADRHEARAVRADEDGDVALARKEFLAAKTYLSIARFPGAITPEKAEVSRDCVRAYLRACAYLSPPVEVVEISYDEWTMTAHLRVPEAAGPLPAVLVMCGSDVFKEDRGWVQEHCVGRGLAALVMDAPGTGENPVPWSPESVGAWEAAIDFLAGRADIDARRIGAFGISRGGYSVMQLAGTAPEKLAAVVAVAGSPVGRLPEGERLERHLATVNERSAWFFGAPGDGPFAEPVTLHELRTRHREWSLAELGLLDRITQPLLMINGSEDDQSPISNIYTVLEHGPLAGKEARIYAGAGHCAPEHAGEWIPQAFDWLATKLGAEPRPGAGE